MSQDHRGSGRKAGVDPKSGSPRSAAGFLDMAAFVESSSRRGFGAVAFPPDLA
jgi:hypothetical protein